jgi:hypothetical protein
MTKATAQHGLPWGRTTGLLGACLATLVGVLRGLDPDVVLVRAATAGVVVGVLGVVVHAAWQWRMQREMKRLSAQRQTERSSWSGVAGTTGEQAVARRRKAE